MSYGLPKAPATGWNSMCLLLFLHRYFDDVDGVGIKTTGLCQNSSVLATSHGMVCWVDFVAVSDFEFEEFS